MAETRAPINFESADNEILLNPRLPKADFESLYRLASCTQEDRSLKGHVWFSTSGSTAESAASVKLVAISKTSLLASAMSVNRHLQVTAQDKWTQVLPHFHVGGFGIEARAFLSRSAVIPALNEQRWDAEHFYNIVKSEHCTLSALVPTQVYDLVLAGYRCPQSLRAVVVGGGILEKDLFMKARELGWPVLPSYGMTETASQIATASLDSLKALEYPAMKLLSHAKARTNDEGFLEVQAESLFTCYAQNLSEGRFTWDPKIDGWFTTEDQGEVHGGVITVQGRKKDYIKIGGEATNMARLRSILDQVALKMDASWPLKVTLIDVPSDRLGTEVHMVSHLSPEQTEKLINQFAMDVLPFEKPRKIYYVDKIPRSDLGKILWSELRRKL
ncbi:o-succinylbenzoate--CoA ligase [Bdellovibrio bacteriovorus]|uniref:O-succinylbenzoate--CoA ligase n=1 Tax=Bdellovibrio bacteriovorus TaxID=959 RepID=A0A150WSK8_BDEBC|nr:AMP-binding protein [Bdellovibrio bacteriovorus]KYG67175.1 o-succinylbenzoate--CoA ligase [Bdellovibrio bacteriovorus]